MTISELETELLKLDAKDRARLAERLLDSLDNLSTEEIESLWADEAQRRDAEWDAHADAGRPAADVHNEARERLK